MISEYALVVENGPIRSDVTNENTRIANYRELSLYNKRHVILYPPVV